jgi:hypothetical protein
MKWLGCAQKTFPEKDQFAGEIEYFSNCVIQNKVIEPDGNEGQVDVAIIEAIYKSAKIGKPVKVDAHKTAARPKLSQKLSKPAHKPVKPVNAPSPAVS